MTERSSRSFSGTSLSARLQTLRSRGRTTLLAALGAPEAVPSPALPTMQGDALAKHHLALALAALTEPGTSKPRTFGKLRLLINQLEQGKLPTATRVSVPSAPPKLLESVTISRRARLMNRAFQGAQHLAQWRQGDSDVQDSIR